MNEEEVALRRLAWRSALIDSCDRAEVACLWGWFEGYRGALLSLPSWSLGGK